MAGKIPKVERRVILLSIVFGFFIVIFDIIDDTVFFYEESFWDSFLFEITALDVVIRSLIMLTFISFGIIMSKSITKRKQAEERIRVSEERFRKIFEDSPIGISIIGKDLQIIMVNQAHYTMLGYTENELKTLSVDDVTYPDDLEIEKSLTEQLVQGKITNFKLEKRFIRKDRQVIWGNLTATATYDEGGKFLFGLGMIEDISEQKRGEKTRLELERQRENFVRMTNHELRTPLTIITGYFDFLEKNITKIDSDRREKSFHAIKSNLNRLESLIEDVSLLTKVDRGLFRIEKSEFNFSQFFQEVIEGYNTLLGEKLKVNAFQLEFPLIIEGDQNRLQQVFDNIVSNAINHTHPEYRQIRLNLEILPSILRINITDNGAGIAPGNLERIFEQFVAIDTEFAIGGTGIGLYLCREIVEAHGGSVTAQSKGEGDGATFIITLPRKQ